jgi:hypothetical protein
MGYDIPLVKGELIRVNQFSLGAQNNDLHFSPAQFITKADIVDEPLL